MKHRIVTGITCVIIAASTVSFPSYLKEKIAQNETPMREITWTYKKPAKLVYAIILKTCGKPEIGKLGEFLACRDRVFVIYSNGG